MVSTRAASQPCAFYCDGVESEIYVSSVYHDPNKGCCYRIRINGVGNWTSYGTASSDMEDLFVEFEGKEIQMWNHNCGSPIVKYKGVIHDHEAIICVKEPIRSSLPYPQITFNIFWFPQPSLPVIIGCKGYHIGYPNQFLPDPWRDQCN